jgi:tungstate transport system ATP-binding protein
MDSGARSVGGQRSGESTPGGVPLLEVHDLVIVRGTRPVLSIEHLVVEEGETLGVVGPNGAGKSTLLLALARLIRPERGTLVFRGAPVTGPGELAFRRRIGFVMPDPLLLDTTVFANVASGLRFRGVPPAEIRERVGRWLERLRIDHLATRPALQVSSGEAQRTSLARALVVEPDLLLLDEPFASVDVLSRATLLDDLEALLDTTGVTCVVVTHDLDEAVRLGDRMAVLLDGRIAQCDLPELVLSSPIDEHVAAFVGVETRIPGRIEAIERGIARVDVGGHRIEALVPLDHPPSIAAARGVLCCLRPEDVTITVDGSGRDDAGNPSSSARNRLAGRIGRLVPAGSLVRVSIDCGFLLAALVTRASAEEMALAEGATVVATFKASAVHLIPRPA